MGCCMLQMYPKRTLTTQIHLCSQKEGFFLDSRKKEDRDNDNMETFFLGLKRHKYDNPSFGLKGYMKINNEQMQYMFVLLGHMFQEMLLNLTTVG